MERYSLRIEGKMWTLYDGMPDKSGYYMTRRGRLSKPPPWLQIVLDVAYLRDEIEPIWAFLDDEFRLLSFKK